MPGVSRQGVRRAGQCAHQRARHRAGRLGAQYLRGGGRPHATRALRATHASFYLSPHTLSIGVIGPGTVGQRAARSAGRPARAAGARIQDRSAGTRDPALAADAAWPIRRSGTAALARAARRRFAAGGSGALHRARARGLSAAHGADRLQRRCRSRQRTIATGSPPAFTSSRRTRRPTAVRWRYYESLKAARRASGAHYLYETTVGAGLPVIQTLRDLRETGDEITQHRGHFLRHAGVSVQCLRRHARRSPRSCARPSSAATPSRIRAMICQAPTWRAN